MMISPKGYYEELMTKTPKEVKKEIWQCRLYIRNLKTKMEAPAELQELLVHPSLDLQLEMAREYLEQAKKAYRDKEQEYVPSLSEKKEIEFNKNIPYITEMKFRSKIYPAGWKVSTCTVKDNNVYIEVKGENVAPPKNFNDKYYTLSKEDFCKKITELYMCEWKKEYNITKPYKVELEKMEEWYLDITYSNEYPSRHYKGNGCSPYNMEEFLKLIRIYKL